VTSPAAVALLYSLCCLIWGSTWLVIKIGLIGVPPFLGAGLRFSLASAVLFSVVAFQRKKLRLDSDGWVAVWSCGLLSFYYGYATTYWAEQYISSGLTAILWCTVPLCVALLARFWHKSETLGPRKLLGIMIGMAGTAALFWTDEKVTVEQWRGMAAALSAALAAAVNLVTVKRRAKNADVLVMNACGMAIGAFCLLATSLALDSYASLEWTRPNVLAIVYLALAGTVVTFMSYYHLLKVMDATKLSTITLVFPVIALLIGSAFGGETVTKGSLLAIAAVLAGVAFALFAPARRKVTAVPGLEVTRS
jgi:drug/metabolite transporter (DMT)-like permease